MYLLIYGASMNVWLPKAQKELLVTVPGKSYLAAVYRELVTRDEELIYRYL